MATPNRHLLLACLGIYANLHQEKVDLCIDKNISLKRHVSPNSLVGKQPNRNEDELRQVAIMTFHNTMVIFKLF